PIRKPKRLLGHRVRVDEIDAGFDALQGPRTALQGKLGGSPMLSALFRRHEDLRCLGLDPQSVSIFNVAEASDQRLFGQIGKYVHIHCDADEILVIDFGPWRLLWDLQLRDPFSLYADRSFS